MPQKFLWPKDLFIAIPGKSELGDLLFEFHEYSKSFSSTWEPWEITRQREAQWWAHAPEMFQKLVALPDLRRNEHLNGSFYSCEEYFKRAQTLDPSMLLVEHRSVELTGKTIPTFWSLTLVSSLSEIQRAANRELPVRFHYYRESTRGSSYKYHELFLFGHWAWKVSQEELAVEPEHFRLLFLEAIDKDRLRFERLKNKFSGLAGAKLDPRREPIPESVRIFVWRRDGGRCVRCGSNERLEFDHIIPICEGGSNTERNLQLLCEPCNRSKSGSI